MKFWDNILHFIPKIDIYVMTLKESVPGNRLLIEKILSIIFRLTFILIILKKGCQLISHNVCL